MNVCMPATGVAPSMEIATEQTGPIASSATAEVVAAASTESHINDKKRAAGESLQPSMTKAAAAKALSSLKVPKQKKQSQYVRFKALLLQDAKDRGDTETTKEITKKAKDAWASVKNMTPPAPIDPSTNTNNNPAASKASSNLGEDTQRYLRFKGRAIKNEQDDHARFNADVKAFCLSFVSAAVALIQWEIIESTESNTSSLVGASNMVVEKLKSISPWSPDVSKEPLIKAIKEARAQIADFKKLRSEKALVTKLRNATDEELLQYVKEHQSLLAQVEEMNANKRKEAAEKAAQDEAKRQQEERELAMAGDINDMITKALYKMMKYDSRGSTMSFVLEGVSQKLFAKAFNVDVGTKTAKIPGHKVGRKSLRYSGYLVCNDVAVKLVGDELVAQTSCYVSQLGFSF